MSNNVTIYDTAPDIDRPLMLIWNFAEPTWIFDCLIVTVISI